LHSASGWPGQRDRGRHRCHGWLLTASLGNITNIGLLAWLARREGFRLSQIFNFERRTWKGDVLLVIAATVVAVPLGYFPNPTAGSCALRQPRRGDFDDVPALA